jgi:hypothetical protein
MPRITILGAGLRAGGRPRFHPVLSEVEAS